MGSLPAVNLLFDPRVVRFQTAHYEVLLQHLAELGWVKQGRGVRGGLSHCPSPAPAYLRCGVLALVRALDIQLPQREGGLGGPERGQAGGPIGPYGQRGSPHRGPHCGISLPRCRGGSAGTWHQQYVRGMVLAWFA